MSEEKKGFLGLGKLFSTIKTKIMGKFITTFLASVVEKLKVKHPKVFASVVIPVALGLQFGFNALIEGIISSVDFLANAGIKLDLPEKFLSLDWILAALNLNVSNTVTDVIMLVLALLVGSQSKEFLPEEKRQEAITNQQKRIQRRELKKIEKEAGKANTL